MVTFPCRGIFPTGEQRQKETLLRRKGVSEEARVSSVFPEVRSAGGAKIKVEALLLKSGISGCTCTSTHARTSRGSGGREKECCSDFAPQRLCVTPHSILTRL